MKTIVKTENKGEQTEIVITQLRMSYPFSKGSNSKSFVKNKRCLTCKKLLRTSNESGFCSYHYHLEYQRRKR